MTLWKFRHQHQLILAIEHNSTIKKGLPHAINSNFTRARFLRQRNQHFQQTHTVSNGSFFLNFILCMESEKKNAVKFQVVAILDMVVMQIVSIILFHLS